MSVPAVAYNIPFDGAGLQGVSSADRPLCAMVSAAAVFYHGTDLRGEFKEYPRASQAAALEEWFHGRDIPWARMRKWVNGLLQYRMPGKIDPVFGDCTLDEYQLASIRHLTVAGGGIGMVPGLGKTLTACVAARHYAHSGEASAKRCWIIAPLNAYGTWKRWEPELRKTFADVQILSKDSLHRLAPSNDGGVLIIDEIHHLRRMEATRTKLAHKLREVFDVGIGLTGTALHGGPEGFLSMVDLCIPGAAWFASRWKAGEYFHCLVKKDIGTRSVSSLVRPTGDNREKFMEFVSSYFTMLNARSELVTRSLIIPEQTVQTVCLGEPWAPLHEEAAALAVSELNSTGELPHAQKVAHLLCASGIEAKIGWLDDMWDDRNEPCVLFANYTATLDAVEAWLKEEMVSYTRVDGSVLGTERAECVRKFQSGEVSIFLGQIGAAGIAVDLFRARISVAFDHSWKADEYAQALARTCRRGQTEHCYHFDLAVNKLQAKVIERLQAAEDFNAEAIEYQELKNVLTTVALPIP